MDTDRGALKMREKPVVILVGPSGVGKSTLVESLLKEYDFFTDIITYTTRPMRPTEAEGSPYHFVTREKFLELKARDFFVETATVHQNLYGTPRDQISEAWRQNRVVLMDVDVQGARTFLGKFPQSLTIFVHPPSFNVLRQRLLGRPGNQAADVELRLENAKKEIAQAGDFACQVINARLESCLAEVKKLIEEYLARPV